MHAILTTTLPRFPVEHENSSHVFEICLPPDDSPWMKRAVVVSFEVFCTLFCTNFIYIHIYIKFQRLNSCN